MKKTRRENKRELLQALKLHEQEQEEAFNELKSKIEAQQEDYRQSCEMDYEASNFWYNQRDDMDYLDHNVAYLDQDIYSDEDFAKDMAYLVQPRLFEQDEDLLNLELSAGICEQIVSELTEACTRLLQDTSNIFTPEILFSTVKIIQLIQCLDLKNGGQQAQDLYTIYLTMHDVLIVAKKCTDRKEKHKKIESVRKFAFELQNAWLESIEKYKKTHANITRIQKYDEALLQAYHNRKPRIEPQNNTQNNTQTIQGAFLQSPGTQIENSGEPYILQLEKLRKRTAIFEAAMRRHNLPTSDKVSSFIT